ncbi:MAG: sensor histidine kinase [Desulfovibrionaceae bacterium]
MHKSECIGRLINSATHDMRNVLAVIRESVGLVQDILRQPDAATRLVRVQQALQSVQEQVNHGAELAEGMGHIGQCAEYRDDVSEKSCDLTRITGDFCVMARRRGKACALELHCQPTAEPILSPAAPLEVFRCLLGIFDACAAVGGGVSLCFRPILHQGNAVIECEVQEGGKNSDMVIAALTGHPLLRPLSPHWAEKLFPLTGGGKGPRFLMHIETTPFQP